jgi:L-histidine Nalpha-methyltransferase / hercynylcysteine S-oxide synthase
MVQTLLSSEKNAKRVLEKGLKLFEDITYLDEYYPTNAEIEALTLHANEIVARIPDGVRLVELGSG